MKIPLIGLCTIALLVGLICSPARADILQIQLDGEVSRVGGVPLDPYFAVGDTFSLVLSFSTTGNYITQMGSCPCFAYGLPFSVTGFVGDEQIDVHGTLAEVHPHGMYFEAYSAIAQGPLLFGPEDNWAIFNFTTTVNGWQDDLGNNLPTYLPDSLEGTGFVLGFEEYFVNQYGGLQARTPVGTVYGRVTSARPIPEPTTLALLSLGAIAAVLSRNRA